MNVYIPVYLFILLFCFFVKGKNSINIKLFVSLGLIFLMMAFRTNWGGDYEPYENWFNFFHGLSSDELSQMTETDTRSEIGYRFLCMICPSFRVVLIVTTLFYCVTLFFFFKEFIPEKYFPYAFTFLFFDKHLLMGSSSIRTEIALCFFLIAIILLVKRRRLWAAVLIPMGSVFHTGVLLMLPVFLIRYGAIRINKQFFWVITSILAIASILFANQIVTAADYVTSSIGIFNRYDEYFDEAVDYSLGMGIVIVIMEIIMLIPIIDVSSSNNYEDKTYIVLKMAIVWTLLMIMPSFGLSERLFFYLDYMLLATVPIVYQCYHDKTMANVFKYYILVYYLWVFYHFLSDPHFVAAWANYNF